MSNEKEVTINILMSYDEFTGDTTAKCTIADKATKEVQRSEEVVFKNKTIAEVEVIINQKMKPYLESESFSNYSRTEIKH